VRENGSPAVADTVARRAPNAARAASAVCCIVSSVVAAALIRTDASASARSCVTYSCSTRATSCTSM
jgi:hypothetical protein